MKILYHILTRGVLLLFLVCILAVFGLLNPIFVWMDKNDLKANGAQWASDITGVEELADTAVINADASIVGMQGDGSRNVVLQLSPEQSQSLMAQIRQDSKWHIERSTCVSPEGSTCADNEADCYFYAEQSQSGEQVEARFCRDTNRFELFVIWT